MEPTSPAPRTETEITRLLSRLAERPTPAVVWYGADGGRVELSGRVLENWIAKTANLLVDDLGMMPGDRLVLDPAVHWRTLVLAAATWRIGAVLALPGAATTGQAQVTAVLDRTGAGPEARPRPEGSAEAAGIEADDRLVLAYPGLALRLPEAEAASDGDIDYCAEIRAHGDHWPGAVRPRPADAALEDAAGALDFAGLQEAAADRAAELPQAPVVHLDIDGWDRGSLVGLLAVWAAGGAAVLSDRPGSEALQRDLAAERVHLTWR
ncbi:TIGR03089 family protein [Kocuria palustris]|uniref:TIGR03089 family protein n=1 Tax=Kocuria palustris TaxID=71999 RepID=UPI00119F964F|nr:TIGR03089 family protein [Kocuria palustris]